MSDVTPEPPKGGNFLNNKVSGIKTSYLIIFGLAVALGAYYWRKRKGATTPVIPTVVDTSGQAGGPLTSSSAGGSGGVGNPTALVPQTNAQWARAALNAAIGNGSVDPTDGANAVTAWLNNQPLTASQSNIIAKLTTAYGQPPEGVLPIPTTHSNTLATPTVYYVPENKSWGVVGPNGFFMQTNKQDEANAWAKQYMPDGNANWVDQATFTSILNANK